MVAQTIVQIRKLIGNHTGSRQTALMRLVFCLALCALLGGVAVLAVASHQDAGLAQQAAPAAAAAAGAAVAQQITYRYIHRSSGITQVQRSGDGGRTWAHGGVVPEPVIQLAPSPVNDTMVFARTDANLWWSETGGARWTRVADLPGRPLSLAMTDHADAAGLIFLGTADHGLYTSTDSGKTWQAAGGRLSLVGAGALAISAVTVNPGSDQVIYLAATFNMATPQGLHSLPFAFVSDDNGRWFEMMDAGPAHRVPNPAPILALVARPIVPAPDAAFLGATVDFPADSWPLAAMATLLMFALLVVWLLGQGPRPAAPLGHA